MEGGTENAAADPAAHARKTADLLATIMNYMFSEHLGSRTGFRKFVSAGSVTMSLQLQGSGRSLFMYDAPKCFAKHTHIDTYVRARRHAHTVVRDTHNVGW